MPVQVGKVYYFINHVYHHFIAEVVDITGKREADVKSVCRIHSCSRGWTEFFRDGAKDDTTFMEFPDGSLTWFSAFEWKHPIPGVKNATKR